MSELIDRQALMDECLNHYEVGNIEQNCTMDWICKTVRNFPAASLWHRVDEELPESGTHVLVCCEVCGINGYRGHYVCDAFHTDAKSIPCSYNDDIDSEYDEETDEYYFPVGWWEVIKNWDDYSCVAISDFVTHWMPLPEPPMGAQE